MEDLAGARRAPVAVETHEAAIRDRELQSTLQAEAEEPKVSVTIHPEAPAVDVGGTLTFSIRVKNTGYDRITLGPLSPVQASGVTFSPAAWSTPVLARNSDTTSSSTVRAEAGPPRLQPIAFNVAYQDHDHNVMHNLTVSSDLTIAEQATVLLGTGFLGGIVGWALNDIFLRGSFVTDFLAFIADPGRHVGDAALWVLFALAGGLAAVFVVGLGKLTSGWQPFVVGNKLTAFVLGGISGLSGIALLEKAIEKLIPGLLPA